MAYTKFQFIKEIVPDFITIERPEIMGKMHNIRIVTSPTQKLVFRFSTKALSNHNLLASKLLKNTNIKTPDVSIYKYGSEYCEVYPFIPGKTLYERIQEGIPQDKLDQVYKDLIRWSYEVFVAQSNKKIDTRLKTPIVQQQTIERTFIDKYFRAINKNNKSICHTDLQTKNILLDNEDKLYGILDLDNITIDYLSTSLLRLINDADKNGYNITKFDAFLGENQTLLKIKKQIKLYSVIRKIYRILPYSR
ncbi:MAG: phosphotransferase [Alphaproteobacteria bacterium]|nr:phosphotransferase [Alphaproteobacteria bacterium]